MKKNKSLIWIVGLVILLLVVLILAKVLPKKPSAPNSASKPSASSQAETPPPMPQVSSIPSAQVPQGMPAGLPWEKGAAVLQNFTAKDPATGKTQSTRVYVSAKTLDENLTVYQKYLQANGWIVVSAVNQPTIKNLFATKASAHLDITIAKTPDNKVTVKVDYVD